MSKIRALAICLFRNGERILVERNYDTVKQDYYWRPLGGGVEFGEHSRDAVIREIREETGEEIENVRLLHVIESFFEADGKPEHEIVFVYDAEFVNRSLYDGIVECFEKPIGRFTACWKTPQEIADLEERLVPEALKQLL